MTTYQQIAVRLNEKQWKMISEVIDEHCKHSTDDWQQWGNQIQKILQSVIKKASQPSISERSISFDERNWHVIIGIISSVCESKQQDWDDSIKDTYQHILTTLKSSTDTSLIKRKEMTGLVNALSNKDPEIRIRAAEAIKESGDENAVKSLVEHLTRMLRYGDIADKIEAIALICGRAKENFFRVTLEGDEKRVQSLLKVRGKIDPRLSLEALSAIPTDEMKAFVYWYVLIALVELGRRNDEVLAELVDASEVNLTYLGQRIDSRNALFCVLCGMDVREETLRAVSYFSGNSMATDVVIGASENRLLTGCSNKGESRFDILRDEIYALGALGDPTTRERLEYWATHGEEQVQKRARIALEFFGKATFDEIQSTVITKFRIK